MACASQPSASGFECCRVHVRKSRIYSETADIVLTCNIELEASLTAKKFFSAPNIAFRFASKCDILAVGWASFFYMAIYR